jgi:hypothetical protein
MRSSDWELELKRLRIGDGDGDVGGDVTANDESKFEVDMRETPKSQWRRSR